MAAALEDAGQQIAHEGATGVADMQRSGGIGRDELDIEVQRPLLGDAPEVVACGPGLVEYAFEPGGGEAHVEESGLGDVDFAQRSACWHLAQGVGKCFGDLQW